MQELTAIDKLRVTAARLVLGVADSQSLKQTADDVLNAGVYSPSLADLALTANPIMSDVAPLYKQALQELALALPSAEDALWIVAGYHLARIVDGEVTPRKGMAILYREVFLTGSLYERTKEYLGDSHDLHHLYGGYDGYDDLYARPDEVSFEGKYGDDAKSALDAWMVEHSREWLAKHADKVGGAMASDDNYRCRVCGYRMEEPPWGKDGTNPQYEICPCCGSESGYEDCTPQAARINRQKWMAAGATWFHPEEKPSGWNLEQQLACIPEQYR